MSSSRNNPPEKVILRILNGETKIIKAITAAEITPRPAPSKPKAAQQPSANEQSAK